MHFSTIDYSETGFFSQLVLDYLKNDARLSKFSGGYMDEVTLANNLNAIKGKYYNRNVLSKTLSNQYKNIDKEEVIINNLNLLLNEKTYCVVTAHQPIIFGGPLYFILKIANTIQLARQFKQQFPQYDFVPIYWMGGEDHDMEEIGTVKMFGKVYKWDTSQSGASGRMSIEDLESTLTQICDVLGSSEYAKQLAAIFQDAYQEKSSLKDATRVLVNTLFGKYGVLVVDGDDADLKSLVQPIMVKELFEPQAYDLVKDTSSALESLGYKPQATPRNINLFYLEDQVRARIERVDNGDFIVVGTAYRFPTSEMSSLVHTHPECLSPNVILRPLYQQAILPAVAFVGGGGELAYWMQQKAVFDCYQVHFPMLVLRTSLQPVLGNQHKKLDKLSIALQDIFLDVKTLEKQYILQHANNSFAEVFDAVKENLLAEFSKLKSIAIETDVTLQGFMAAEEKRLEEQIKAVTAKIEKSEKAKHSVAIDQIHNLKGGLFPDNNLWEREESMAALWVRLGPKLIEAFIESLDPMVKKFYIVTD